MSTKHSGLLSLVGGWVLLGQSIGVKGDSKNKDTIEVQVFWETAWNFTWRSHLWVATNIQRDETLTLSGFSWLWHYLKDSLEPCSPTVFLTVALLVLEALQTNKSPLLATQMQELCNTCRVVLQWIPAHCGIPGNEQADQLAKCGAQEEQPSTSIHYQKKTTIIKTALKPRKEKDAYDLIDRPG